MVGKICQSPSHDCCSIAVLSDYNLATNNSPFPYLKLVIGNLLHLNGYYD